MGDNIKINFFKGKPSWYRTIIVVGLPRSGKTTISNLLATCQDTEALDEPLDLAILAQKGCWHKKSSKFYKEYKDSFLALIENYVSELVLGRIYNFRKSDASCIYNFKTKLHVRKAHKKMRKRDALKHLKNIKLNLVLAFNDIENALKFIEESVPKTIFIYVKRNHTKIANEIKKKGWFNNYQLQNQANLSPGYNAILKLKNKTFFIPYLITSKKAKDFLKLNNKNRSINYAELQDNILSKNINKINSQVIKINYESFSKNFLKNGNKLLKKIKLKPKILTKSFLIKLQNRK